MLVFRQRFCGKVSVFFLDNDAVIKCCGQRCCDVCLSLDNIIVMDVGLWIKLWKDSVFGQRCCDGRWPLDNVVVVGDGLWTTLA